MDDSTGDETLPLVPTELVGTSERDPFDDIDDFDSSTEVPMASIEIPLPQAIFDSLPAMENRSRAASVAESAQSLPLKWVSVM